VLGSVIAVAFQITFCAEMHANDVFLFFKNYFWHQHNKTIQNVQIILNFSKKNI
jgi:flagellar motor component MotA